MNHQRAILANLSFPSGVELIDRTMAGYKAYRVLAFAVEMQLFDWLDENGASSREEITAGLNLNDMFTRSFLQSLTDMGLLTCTNEKYANSKAAKNFLVRRNPCYQGDWLKIIAGRNSKWHNLKATLTSDAPHRSDFYAGPGEELIKAMAQCSLRGELQEVAGIIAEWGNFSRARTLLDIGGGHGLYAIALCQLNPELRAVVFDKPRIVGFAGKFIADYGLEDRMEVRGGDMLSDELGSGYDIVLISHLLYKFRKDLPSVFQRVRACLQPGGLLALNHWFCSPDCRSFPDGLRELDKAFHSFGHPLCHMEDFNRLITKAGFKLLQVKDIHSVFGVSKLHLAVKNQP